MRVISKTAVLMAAAAALWSELGVHGEVTNNNIEVSPFANTAPLPGAGMVIPDKRVTTSNARTTDVTTDTTLTETTTTATTAPSTTPTTGSGPTDPVTAGSPIKCAFRYSLPMVSNVAGEAVQDTASSTAGSTATSEATPAPTTETTTGSSTGHTDVGGVDGETVAPVTEAPGTTTTAPRTRTPSTKTPTTTTRPSATTVAPSTNSSNTDSLLRHRRLQDVNGGETTTAPGPAPRTKKPTTTTVAPTVDTPTTGSSATDTTPATVAPGGTTSSSTSSGAGAPVPETPTTLITGEFTCDATFYGAWAKLNLVCGEEPLDVNAAVAQSQCLIYGGTQTEVIDIKMCMSVCKFPKCANGTWDYAAQDGFTSEIYQNLNFVDLVTHAGLGNTIASDATEVFSKLKLKTDRECSYQNDASFKSCQCENLIGKGGKKDTSKTVPDEFLPPVNKGLESSNTWADGKPKKTIDKVGIASAAIGSSAAVVSVAVGGVMSVAGGVMSTTSGVAAGASAGASLGLAMAAVDLCQFGVMINQMNLDASPRVLQEMGRRMAPSTFSFIPFGRVEEDKSGRRLSDVAAPTNQTQGMERYAQLVGVRVDMLFYVTLAGLMALSVAPFVLYAVFMVVSIPFVNDFGMHARKWLDKTIGALMMVLILSEYVVGVTATFQICYNLQHDKMDDAGLYLAIFALLFFAIGTILYGYYVVKSHEDDLRDLGTKDHFEKPVHARYGPLYDEYKFEGRFFFAPKLMLALLCGITTGMIFLDGMWQIIILISLHIVFLFYLEVKQPYPNQFVQKTSSFVIIIKISALFLTLFLLASASGFQASIPMDLREGVGFAIIGLQVLVLVALMIRQMYIFYMTWKLKREDSDKKLNEGIESFYPLGDNMHGTNMPILGGGVATPLQRDNHQETPDQHRRQQKLRGLQGPPSSSNGHGNGPRRTHTVVRHEEYNTPASHRRQYNNEVDL